MITDSIVQHAYVRLTMELMEQFGVSVVHNESLDLFKILPQVYTAQTFTLEADASSSCYALAFAALTNGHVIISNLPAHTNQPDIGMLELFERYGLPC